MEDAPAIYVKDLHKEFGNVKALDGVSLTVDRGIILGLLGANGAGKTTLIRSLIGSTKPTNGEMLVLGFNPTTQKRALRKEIGYMPQEPALYDDLSLMHNIRFFGRAYSKGNLIDEVNEVIEFVGLAQRARDPVYKLSGGMKQRASLACALVHKPKMLFLDEPTSGIDPQLRNQFWKHFRGLTEQGVTIIVSTHQMDEAMYCDKVVVLHKGKLLADSYPRELLHENSARISITINGKELEHSTEKYPIRLPKILQEYGLDPSITSIDVIEDTLESVVLELINQQENQSEVGDYE